MNPQRAKGRGRPKKTANVSSNKINANVNSNKQRVTKKELGAVAVLSAGTLLEYFDLMLYVHLTSLLTTVFFAPTDQRSAALINVFGYSMTYLFRPIGAIIFGYIGDVYGRKSAIISTISLMSLSCLIIFFLPSYAEIGIFASIILTFCRIIQGMSSMGEMIGAEIYITELLKGKPRFIAVGMLSLMPSIGTLLALVVAHYAMQELFNWRYAFLIGFFILVVGGVLRSKLKTTKDRIKIKPVFSVVTIKTYASLICLNCVHPTAFFIVFFGLSDILKSQFGYTEANVIDNSFLVVNGIIIILLINIFLLSYVRPLLLSRIRITIFTCAVISLPFLLNNASYAWQITLLQLLLFGFGKDDLNCLSVRHSVLPTCVRFRAGAMSLAISRVLICVCTSYGITLAKPYLGNYTFTIFALPICIAYFFGLEHLSLLDANSKAPSSDYYK